MPRYEYSCKECNGSFVVFHRVSETPQCPSCKSENLKKILSFSVTHEESKEEKGARERIKEYISEMKEDLESTDDVWGD